MSRTPQEVFADHSNRLGTGDRELISHSEPSSSPPREPSRSEEVLRGIGGLLADLRYTDWQLTPRFADDLLLLQWSASTGAHEVTDGLDTFVLRNGLISAQPLPHTPSPPTSRTA